MLVDLDASIALKDTDFYIDSVADWITIGTRSIPKEERSVVMKGPCVYIPAPNAESVWVATAEGAKMIYKDDEYWLESSWLAEWYKSDQLSEDVSESVTLYAEAIRGFILWSKQYSLRLYKHRRR